MPLKTAVAAVVVHHTTTLTFLQEDLNLLSHKQKFPMKLMMGTELRESTLLIFFRDEVGKSL